MPTELRFNEFTMSVMQAERQIDEEPIETQGGNFPEWSRERQTLLFLDAQRRRQHLPGLEQSFSEACAASWRLLAKSSQLYDQGRYNEALDNILHPVVDLLEKRDIITLSALMASTSAHIVALERSAKRSDLPREADLWVGILLLTKRFKKSLPARESLQTVVRAFLSHLNPTNDVRRLLRRIS